MGPGSIPAGGPRGLRPHPTQARRDPPDVVGYGRLIAEDEAGTIQTLKSYRDLVKRLIGGLHKASLKE